MDGYLAMLVGQAVPHEKPYLPTPAEATFWQKRTDELAAEARKGMGVLEALKAIRQPGLQWG
jgi:hypothetical protein